jgi:hypothetical protein
MTDKPSNTDNFLKQAFAAERAAAHMTGNVIALQDAFGERVIVIQDEVIIDVPESAFDLLAQLFHKGTGLDVIAALRKKRDAVLRDALQRVADSKMHPIVSNGYVLARGNVITAQDYEEDRPLRTVFDKPCMVCLQGGLFVSAVMQGATTRTTAGGDVRDTPNTKEFVDATQEGTFAAVEGLDQLHADDVHLFLRELFSTEELAQFERWFECTSAADGEYDDEVAAMMAFLEATGRPHRLGAFVPEVRETVGRRRFHLMIENMLANGTVLNPKKLAEGLKRDG